MGLRSFLSSAIKVASPTSKYAAAGTFIAGCVLCAFPPTAPIGLGMVYGSSAFLVGRQGIKHAARFFKKDKNWRDRGFFGKIGSILKVGGVGFVGALGTAMVLPLAGATLTVKASWDAGKRIGSWMVNGFSGGRPPGGGGGRGGGGLPFQNEIEGNRRDNLDEKPTLSRSSSRSASVFSQSEKPKKLQKPKPEIINQASQLGDKRDKALNETVYKVAGQDAQHVYFQKFYSSTVKRLIAVKHEDCFDLHDADKNTHVQLTEKEGKLVAKKASDELIGKAVKRRIESGKGLGM